MKVNGIARETLEFILSVSKSMAPKEFAGLLQVEDGVIAEVLILPGTESSEQNAVIKLFMMPNVSSVGSVHSHPGSNITPSNADLRLFGKTGSYHIIVGAPYDENSWQCYNGDGEPIELPVLDVELKEPDFI
ncbi:Proteasome lid subunit RPN8/RPN11, contains Jab1/MPN metalloenzyme (JAMM) motif [Methanococcoides vulcani]|uniref:Proteasome lid subunit RPN8/RPN11, contains Jab1/MPN metalloenzyme (JAMM) motif n=1 Tax=Methanococcoides vulcani TaxID=1353158 RepID=A0A1I0A1E5_9EURY|nr:Mov34/MPN/PAD-1 family protein [Methanococcoides vulcani]SES86976.1 Proteasome lid subunit RPN8/RPN11, contains Jab1/MPN metalloenzyme (JAMM) motif [Methanococcoides vulcani]